MFRDHGSFAFVIRSFDDHSFGIQRRSMIRYYDSLRLMIFCFEEMLLLVFNNLLNPISVALKGISLLIALIANFFYLTLLAFSNLTSPKILLLQRMYPNLLLLFTYKHLILLLHEINIIIIILHLTIHYLYLQVEPYVMGYCQVVWTSAEYGQMGGLLDFNWWCSEKGRYQSMGLQFCQKD